MIRMALQVLEYERGVPSDTPNKQLCQNAPDPHSDTRGSEAQNWKEYKDRGTAHERPSGVAPERTSDDNQFDQHTTGGCWYCDNIIVSVNVYQLRKEAGKAHHLAALPFT